MASGVNCNAPGKRRAKCRNSLDADDVMEIRAEFHRVAGDVRTGDAHMRSVCAHVQRTAAREHDRAIVVGECLHERPQRFVAERAEARVGGRLATARGARRHFDIDSELLQHLKCSDRDLRVKLVNVAGREERDPHLGAAAAGGTVDEVPFGGMSWGSMRMTRYVEGVVPGFFKPCHSLEAMNTTSPGFAIRVTVP